MGSKNDQQRFQSSEQILEILSRRGLRITAPRKVLIGAIHQHAGVFTGDGLYEELQTSGTRIGRATIFRTIDVLVDAQLLERVHQPDGSHGYVMSGPGHHHHLVCSACGEVVEFQGCTIDEMIVDLAQQTDFHIQGHWLEIFGTCSSCQNSSSP